MEREEDREDGIEREREREAKTDRVEAKYWVTSFLFFSFLIITFSFNFQTRKDGE